MGTETGVAQFGSLPLEELEFGISQVTTDEAAAAELRPAIIGTIYFIIVIVRS